MLEMSKGMQFGRKFGFLATMISFQFVIVLVYVEWLEIIHFQFDGTNVQFYHYYLHYFHLQLQIAASNVSVVDIFECCQYCTLIV